MTTTIAVVNQKGGVGKTTTAYHLGIHLAAAGKNVLWIDLDPQANLSHLADPDDNTHCTIGDVLGGSIAPLADLVDAHCKTGRGPDIITSSLDLSNVAAGLMTRNLGRVEALERAIRKTGHAWDIILIDCPPDVGGVLTLNALWAAHAVIIPCEPEALAIEGLAQMADVLHQVEQATGRTIRREIVATMMDTHSSQHQHGLENLIAGSTVVIIPRRNKADARAAIHGAYAPLAQRVISAMEGMPNA